MSVDDRSELASDRPASCRTRRNAALEQLAAKRLRVALGLTAAMMAVYFGFILPSRSTRRSSAAHHRRA